MSVPPPASAGRASAGPHMWVRGPTEPQAATEEREPPVQEEPSDNPAPQANPATPEAAGPVPDTAAHPADPAAALRERAVPAGQQPAPAAAPPVAAPATPAAPLPGPGTAAAPSAAPAAPPSVPRGQGAVAVGPADRAAGPPAAAGPAAAPASRAPHPPASGGPTAYGGGPVSWVGAHGGAGSTTLADLVGGLDLGRRWPDPSRGESGRVLLVARTHASGLRSASRALEALHSGECPAGLDLLAVVLVADAPGRLPFHLAQRVRVLRSVADVHRVPWVPAWRGEMRTGAAPKTVRMLAELAGTQLAHPKKREKTR
ncbi:DUF6668 family protein [Streptomyces qinglanensis]|uniref:DUF6668 family protein n=1 Tax=Streptomyces qinglanensis TaxID=943816 RepID=UPI00085BFD69